MEYYCDIMDQLPTDTYNSLFGDKVKEFLQLKTLKSKIKAKIKTFEKLRNQQPVPPVLNVAERNADVDDDLAKFLKLNEEERDSWGQEDEWHSSVPATVTSRVNNSFNKGKFFSCSLMS